MVILGLWIASIGYGIAYAGWAKLGGDLSYSLADAFQGKTVKLQAFQAPTAPGTTQGQLVVQQQAQQTQLVSFQPLGQAA